MNIYFGDLHNHCAISYGFGSLENALMEAAGHLDFCAVTGHALWPDIYERNSETAFIIDFHNRGFEKLEENWDNVRSLIADANEEGSFITFQSYEMHSSEFGDHHILSPDDSLGLEKAGTPGDILKKLRCEAIAVPHHIAYTPGYRGISWEHFDEKTSPVVEVYSKHGCGISDMGCEPYLHTMGPADGRNTAYMGLLKGKKFGFAGSTDHHAGYPGSYGDGLTAVCAPELTRNAIWDAIRSRRTYAVTGDRIRCGFDVNGVQFGGESEAKDDNTVELDIRACDFIEKAVIYRNMEPVDSIYLEDFKTKEAYPGRYKIRVETGWGRKDEPYRWNMRFSIKGGRIVSVDKCFRGRSVLAPREGEEFSENINRMKNRVLKTNGEEAVWECETYKNPTTRHPATCAVIIELEGGKDTEVSVEANERKISTTVGNLSARSESFHMQNYNSEACLIHRAVPEHMYTVRIKSLQKAEPGDFFHAYIKQTNGQCAWISPVFMV